MSPDAIADSDIIVDCYAEGEKFGLIVDPVMVEAAEDEVNGEREERDCRQGKLCPMGMKRSQW